MGAGSVKHLELSTPAKVNLYLDVLRRRADGYHDIATVFLPLPWLCDKVAVELCSEPGVGMHISGAGADLPADGRNLCQVAARVFAESAKLEPHWQIRLAKNIPVAAGLGGGSSDAAAVLLLLNSLHGGILERPALLACARKIGADVGFFLEPRPAVGLGLGDELAGIACRAEIGLVLVHPRFPVPAAWAYAHCRPAATLTPDKARRPELDDMLAALRQGLPENVARHSFNALEAAVLRKFPLTAMIRSRLLEFGCLNAMISGSGPTVFGICRPGDTAAVSAACRAAFPHLGVFAGNTCPVPDRNGLNCQPSQS